MEEKTPQTKRVWPISMKQALKLDAELVRRGMEPITGLAFVPDNKTPNPEKQRKAEERRARRLATRKKAIP